MEWFNYERKLFFKIFSLGGEIQKVAFLMPASVLENSSSNGRTWHGNLGGNAVSPHVMFVETKMTLPYNTWD